MEHEFGIVLSGGGVRGAAHVGLLKALTEQDIYPTAVSGTSAGAIVGSLYAAEVPLDEILGLFKKTHLFRWGNYTLSKPGLLDSEKFVEVLSPYLADRRFEDLDRELYVAATDLLKGDCRIFHSGPVIKPVLASAAFPFVFSPVTIEGGLYNDGGSVNNLPIEPLQGCCRQLIGSYVNPLNQVKADDLEGLYQLLDRTLRIANNHAWLKKSEQCDWFIAPEELADYGFLEQNRVDEMYEIGYTHGKEMVDMILREEKAG